MTGYSSDHIWVLRSFYLEEDIDAVIYIYIIYI